MSKLKFQLPKVLIERMAGTLTPQYLMCIEEEHFVQIGRSGYSVFNKNEKLRNGTFIKVETSTSLNLSELKRLRNWIDGVLACEGIEVNSNLVKRKNRTRKEGIANGK